MLKTNSSTTIYKKCANQACQNNIEIKIYAHPDHKDYGQPIVRYRSALTCSRECQTAWQLATPWEDRIGKVRAEEIRKVRSDWATNNNPSTWPGVAERISNSMKKFCEDNPEARTGENNGFYGKQHTEEQKKQWQETKTGKWSYNKEQKAKQTKNTPKKENHPNWNGGSSSGEYGPEFTKELKQEVKESYENSCQLCGTTGVDLDVHHIDYDKLNNRKSNLVPLCKVCHGKTNYDRQKWQSLFEGMLDRI